MQCCSTDDSVIKTLKSGVTNQKSYFSYDYDVNVSSVNTSSLYTHHVPRNMSSDDKVLRDKEGTRPFKEPRQRSEARNWWHLAGDTYNYVLS